jgi:hypothetical protein
MTRQEASWEEGVALGVLQDLGDPDPPMNAFSLANALGLKVVETGVRTARLVGDTILLSAKARPVRQHGLIAHELGHWALMQVGQQDTEDSASYVGAALMLPQRHFSADLKATGWDLRELRAKHIHCSAEMIARRIAALRDAAVSVFDQGKLTRRIVSPWLPEGYRRVSRFERALADQALTEGEAVNAGNLTWAFPVFEGAWRRVIVVVEAEQLALRY